MKKRWILTALLVMLTLVFAATLSAAQLKLEISESAREEISRMGNVAYLSVFEVGSG
ncbi:MAG: hypothetical protein ACLFN0_01820 [Thermovirgaceae bacterium]